MFIKRVLFHEDKEKESEKQFRKMTREDNNNCNAIRKIQNYKMKIFFFYVTKKSCYDKHVLPDRVKYSLEKLSFKLNTSFLDNKLIVMLQILNLPGGSKSKFRIYIYYIY